MWLSADPRAHTRNKVLTVRLLKNNNTEPQNSRPVGNKGTTALQGITFILNHYLSRHESANLAF
jgi:hypothetical protein